MTNRFLLRTAVLAVLACLLCTSLVSANSLDVNSIAAVDGNQGLELLMDGGTDQAYVQDDTPNGETTYRASFWLKRDDLFMDNCGGTCSTRYVTFLARQQNPGASVFRIIMARLAQDGQFGARYVARFGARNDNGTFLFVGSVLFTGSIDQRHITLEWQAGDPFTNNGIVRLLQSPNGGTPQLVGERTDIQNGTMSVDFVRMGAVSGLTDQATDSNSTGSMFFDSFESFRTLLP